MNNEEVAKQLIKLAKKMVAMDNAMDYIINQMDLSDLEDYVDEQTFQLAVDVYEKLQEKLKLTSGEEEALNRLSNSIKSKSSMMQAGHRNNIFKAAHAIGIKLPSSSF